MTWNQVFTSSIGKKLVMALSGIFLILFLVAHVGINATIFADLFDPTDDGEMFNKAAHFMGSTVVIRILEIGLFFFIFLHIIQGLYLEVQNRSRRDVKYAVPMGNKGSKWYSRAMGLLGTILLIFMILHWWHFWMPGRGITHGWGVVEMQSVSYDGHEMHNMFLMMKQTFQYWWVVIVYVVACASLAYHLAHGFQSAFRTMGVHNKRWVTLISSLGLGFSILVPALFAAMPIAMKLGWVA